MAISSLALAHLGWDETLAAAFDAVAPPGTVPARVTRTAARTITAAAAGGSRELPLAGHLLDAPPPGGITTGDWVAVDADAARAVVPRRSALLRHAAGRTAVAQAVAANLDVVFIAVPLGGHISLRRIERSLAVAWSSGAGPVVLLTKADLSADLAGDVAAATAVAAGAPVIATSAAGVGIDAVRVLLPQRQTGAMIGPSGAGKSTLINVLLGGDALPTAAVRSDGRGRHTTTDRELHVLPGGGLMIDTPGMREMGVWDAQDGIDAVFADINDLAMRCRFSDCSHAAEPGCQVRAAAATDPAILDRLASLRKLEREQRHQDLQVDSRLRAQSRRDLKNFARSIRHQPHR